MRILVVGLVTWCLSCSAAQMPPPRTDPLLELCDPEQSSHTNPPIIARTGNSVKWFQCDRGDQQWKALTPSYYVFKDDQCNPTQQVLDADWFGTATENGKATLDDNGKERMVSRVELESDDYTLTITYKAPDKKYSPNVIELCKKQVRCCRLAPAALPGKIPYEFEAFDDQAIKYGTFGKGNVPLQFETCKNIGCQH